MLLVIALAVLLGGGKLTGLLDGGEQVPVSTDTAGQSQSAYNSGMSQSTGNSQTEYQYAGQTQTEDTQTGSGNVLSLTGSDGTVDLSNLLSSFLGSGGSSLYDFTGSSSLFQQYGFSGNSSDSSSSSGHSSSSAGSSAQKPDETVAAGARDKFTRILGRKKDEVTLLVYMCGTDLESQNGMGTADLKEMTKAEISDQVNVIVYTGGCRRWRNSVISSSVNQIYQIKNGGLYCLEKNMGSGAMTSPETLTSFIQYGAERFPANRMCLIFWDHGGGSVSGYGYDEKAGRGVSMSLAGINTALKNAGQKFDFIGFDACLMATVENGIMLSQYADYMIGSEEAEPGVGWYYTNWLTQLSKNTSMPTIEIGKKIADDFTAVCSQQCRGQGTTLSVVDLAELQATVPKELTSFSVSTNDLIQNKDYKTVSKARSRTREFAQSSRIDQIDLVHFARNMGTTEGKKLAKALQGAVKYNRTGGGISDAYGLSIYFPYKQAGKVKQMVSTYQAIGMDEAYTRCIQEFASMEVSGQAVAGTPMYQYGSQGTALPGLMDSLLGNGSYSGGSYSSTDAIGDLIGSLFGGSSSGGIFDLFAGRSLTQETITEYLEENHFEPENLIWKDGKMTLSKEQWSLVDQLTVNAYVDDGTGFIELGADNLFTIEDDSLISDFDGTWVSVNGQPVAYYSMGSAELEGRDIFYGFVPAMLNGTRVNLILAFDSGEGSIIGAQTVYADGETEAQAKTIIGIGRGDRIQFLCDFYNYKGEFVDAYRLGDEMILGDAVEIANTPIGRNAVVNYCFTDIYNQPYWTPVAP